VGGQLSITFECVQHVQLAIPEGGEEDSRRFWGEVVGMTELAKPPALAARGGCWFRAGGVEVHLGVERDFAPARKAHPGILVDGLAELAARLAGAGVEIVRDGELPAYERFYASDPFGNRLEFMELARPSSLDR
jgi:catechol 2,3-dioxygenase-like lactoylglutathione lyase family enzyme